MFIAIDGTAGGGTVSIALSETGETVEIVISGGPHGDPAPRTADIPPSEQLSEGGLHAARAILTAFGGALDEHPSENGRAFHVRLPLAR
jgi:signal transduction histidine kinase